MEGEYDCIIIGGGIIGSMTARWLSRYRLKTLLIEKLPDIGAVTTAANSAIVHPGYDPLPGTLKASLNVTGNRMWDELAGELNFEYDRCGDYVVAIGPDELPTLDKLLEQGRRNGVPGVCIISADEMLKREPHINPAVSGALWAPTGGVCDPFMAAVAAAENALQNGVQIALETEFQDFIIRDGKVCGIRTNHGEFTCRWVVNAAGLQADDVMHRAGERPEFSIRPRRGEYFILDESEIQINNVLFPVPSSAGKGILVTTTVHGNTILGPNAQFMDDREDFSMTPAGMDEVLNGAKKLVPSVSPRQVIAGFAGLRATGNAACQTPGVTYNQDFIVELASNVRGLVNLGGIESPGLTSAPAIAVRVIELMKSAGEKLNEKHDWNPIRPARPHFRLLDTEERAALVQENPAYGRVVCRCELVTEGEILAEIHAPIPARTYDAIKRRTWLGTGRCQGGFDMPRVINLLAAELGCSPFEVTKKGAGSEFLVRLTKQVEG